MKQYKVIKEDSEAFGLIGEGRTYGNDGETAVWVNLGKNGEWSFWLNEVEEVQ